MPVKKSELYSSHWASCDDLRGGMDASEYKDYVLVLLFLKYISDIYAGVPYAPITVQLAPKSLPTLPLLPVNNTRTQNHSKKSILTLLTAFN
jgi:type I restriction enzyme M protein